MESGFEIDGTIYAVPDLSTLTMGERRVLFDYAGLVEEDFVRLQDETDEDLDARHSQLMRNPGFIQALMHLAYARGNAKLSREKIAALIENTTYLDAIATLATDEPEEATDENPPDLTTRTPGSDARSSSIARAASSGSSGSSDSSRSSGEREELAATTGATK